MDQSQFLSELFEHYDDDTRPSETIQNRALRKAKYLVGVADIANLDAEAEERAWLENRVERFAIDDILTRKAEDFNYNKAYLSQVFDNFKVKRIALDEDWKEIRGKIKLKKGLGSFQAIPSGFEYDSFGRPL